MTPSMQCAQWKTPPVFRPLPLFFDEKPLNAGSCRIHQKGFPKKELPREDEIDRICGIFVARADKMCYNNVCRISRVSGLFTRRRRVIPQKRRFQTVFMKFRQKSMRIRPAPEQRMECLKAVAFSAFYAVLIICTRKKRRNTGGKGYGCFWRAAV